jgi:hypothetical protein
VSTPWDDVLTQKLIHDQSFLGPLPWSVILSQREAPHHVNCHISHCRPSLLEAV